MFFKKNKDKTTEPTSTQDNQSKVIIHTGESYYVIDLGIEIIAEGIYVKPLYENKTIEIPIRKPTLFKFDNWINKMLDEPEVQIMVLPNAITEIHLEWNKTTIEITHYKRKKIEPSKGKDERNDKEENNNL